MRLQPHKPREGKMLKCLLIPMWKLFTYFWQPSAIYVYICIKIYEEAQCTHACASALENRREHHWVQKSWGLLIHHSTTQCRKGHLNSGAVITLGWQYSTWGISTDLHVALEGDAMTARLSSEPLSMHRAAMEPCTYPSAVQMLSSWFCSSRAFLYSLNRMQ